jgi:triosephosphate isomerase (TIM)
MTPVPKLVAGNWKMHLRVETARRLAEEVARAAREVGGADVALFPAHVHLAAVREALAGSTVALGAQTCHDRPEGAHTGEVAAEMLADAGVATVLCGHSERRQAGESDAMVAARVRAALRAGLRPLLCVGETEAERDAGATDAVLRRQTSAALTGLAPADLARLDVAYEPVWAIGTGRTATTALAVAAHRTVRGVLSALCAGGPVPRVLYGGSVKPSNAAELMAAEGVDGVLVGGASLDGASFRAILECASRRDAVRS